METAQENPNSAGLSHALGALLLRGYTLTNADIAKIMPYYNYRPDVSNVKQLIFSYDSQQAFAKQELRLTRTKYQGRTIYLDGNLPIEQTDIEITKAKIDDVKERSYAKKKKGAL